MPRSAWSSQDERHHEAVPMRRSPRRPVQSIHPPPRSQLLAVLGLAAGALAAADGPGLGNVDWRGTSVQAFDVVARFDETIGAPEGHGFVTMHRGYLLVLFSSDGGGGRGSGGMAVYDVSDPRSPRNVFTTAGNAAYGPGSSDYAGDLREPHGFSIAGDVLCMTSNGSGAAGLQFWDLSDPTAPDKLSQIDLPGLGGGDYDSTAWWVSWQGRYAYVAGTNNGLFIVDATDPRAPVLLDRGGAPNPLPLSATGSFRINTVFAVGNLLVIARSDGTGIATLDISDPADPRLLDVSSDSVGYSMLVNGNRIYGAHDPARVWDISDPTAIAPAGRGPDVAAKGGYGTFQDGVFHYGSSSSYVKLAVDGASFTSLGTVSPGGFNNPDWDFATALGNLVLMGNDHGGSALIVHQRAPDATGPAVNMVVPRDGATGQAATTRVGLTFTDHIDTRTVDSGTVIVRPRGGAALAGRYAHQLGIVSFWPDQPLRSGTTYEVVVPAGGIRDVAGNAAASTFTSTFTIAGSGGGGAGTTRTITAEVRQGGAAVDLAVTITPGGITSTGTAHTFDGLDPARAYSLSFAPTAVAMVDVREPARRF